jgi:hypothetical protein
MRNSKQRYRDRPERPTDGQKKATKKGTHESLLTSPHPLWGLWGCCVLTNSGRKLKEPYVVQHAPYPNASFFSVAGVFVASGMLGFCLCAVLAFSKIDEVISSSPGIIVPGYECGSGGKR